MLWLSQRLLVAQSVGDICFRLLRPSAVQESKAAASEEARAFTDGWMDGGRKGGREGEGEGD